MTFPYAKDSSPADRAVVAGATRTDVLLGLAGIDADDVTEEWQVVWFPLNKPDQELTTTDEAKARARFAKADRDGANPILSMRQVISTPWTIVENSVTRPGSADETVSS